jgi:hypothetical protein
VIRWAALLAVAAVAACGSLPDQGNGIVALEIRIPDSTLAINHSDTLHARAVNLQGDSVPAAVFWRTPDTALITLDSVTGVVVALTNTGSARVQARTGTLLSDILSIGLRDSTIATGIRATP